MIRFTLVALALGLGAAALASCNTVHGIGRDIEAAGRTIAKTSDEVVQGDDRQKRHAQPAAQSQRTTTTTTTTPNGS